ncbi:hypothetical protein J2T09_004877 [Neorhizobium huautlense]|uniref:Uncharacterized protein n=1 Tax=Neorhizobium huautlense TaxID=67774 RepID=A0ABT9Q076_9HYPH|nr:hypothetical protein [Neorhizobium huautlense]MDP9840097.1 hypothetical protein [Neorhizobium huautlense]
MGKKLDSVHRHLIDGLSKGLVGHELYEFVAIGCREYSAKRLKRASLAAMAGGTACHRVALEAVYSLAVHGSLAAGRHA